MQIEPSQQLKAARKHLELSLEAFGKGIGVSTSAVSDWERGKTPVALRVARAIEKEYGVSSDWLLEGKGEMLVPRSDPEDAPIVVPILSVQPCMGNGSAIEDYVGVIGGMEFNRQWLRRAFSIPPENLYLMEAIGDSMMPTIPPNEMIFVDGSKTQDFLRLGIWVLRVDDQLFVKRIKRVAPNQYQATSDNPVYEPIDLDETAQPMGRVVGGLPKLF